MIEYFTAGIAVNFLTSYNIALHSAALPGPAAIYCSAIM